MDRLPEVRLNQNDFVSTFPWGLRSDEVRIRQQEVENLLLDAETLAAMAVMLGDDSRAEKIDNAWKTILNSQNHDIHVCTQEEAGIAWCNEAEPVAAAIRDESAAYIAKKVGGAVTINPLGIPRTDASGETVPPFGIRAATEKSGHDRNGSWDGWFDTGGFLARLNADGTLSVKAGKGTGTLGSLTVEMDGRSFSSAEYPPCVKESGVTKDCAFAVLEGSLGEKAEIHYSHRITVTSVGIDYETTLDYGEGVNFGPDIKDFEAEPRRTHYFQHERKLCMNFSVEGGGTEFLYNSPFLTWTAEKSAKSIESTGWAALQNETIGLMHMNLGQGGYAREGSSARHVLCFSPHDYIYGEAEKIMARGRHVHRFRFFPYAGDWRQAGLPDQADLFNRQTVTAGKLGKQRIPSAVLLRIEANSTHVTALFERGGKYYLRVAEWAGQEDEVTLHFGDGTAVFTEVTHGLAPIAPMIPVFHMKPWEIKTIQIDGKAVLLQHEATPVKRNFSGLPSGWERPSQFISPVVPAKPRRKSGVLYFSTGYHDGFVRPMERHSKTMAIEMERTRKYDGYAQAWELGGSCWVRMGVNEPGYLEELKTALRENRLEIIGGTWCEPFSLIISGESNIRQMFYGMRAIRENLDYQVTVYGNQEHGTYAQMPQILRSFGLRAVVNRTQWAPYGYESAVDADVCDWIGPDGSSIAMIPRYCSMNYKNCPWDDRNLQNGSVTGHNRVWRTREKFEQMLREALDHGIERPLMTMLEDIWADFLRTTDDEIEFYDSLPFVRFISLTEYLRLYGVQMD